MQPSNLYPHAIYRKPIKLDYDDECKYIENKHHVHKKHLTRFYLYFLEEHCKYPLLYAYRRVLNNNNITFKEMKFSVLFTEDYADDSDCIKPAFTRALKELEDDGYLPDYLNDWANRYAEERLLDYRKYLASGRTPQEQFQHEIAFAVGWQLGR